MIQPGQKKLLLNDLKLEKWSYAELPSGYFDLRAEIYGTETQFLPKTELVDKNDRAGIHYAIVQKSTGLILAATTMIDARLSDFSEYSLTPRDQLYATVLATRGLVRKEFRNLNLFSIILYWAFSDSRSLGFKNVVSYVEEGEIAAKKIIEYQIDSSIPTRSVVGASGKSYTLSAFYERLPQALINIAAKFDTEYFEFVKLSIMIPELEATIRREAGKFFSEGRFVESVHAKTLTKKQYVESCINNHTYVRWTTRLLAKMVSVTEDRELRNHYLDHLTGEVDHDLMIEKDMAYLGADLNYMKKLMVPHPYIQQFMAIQESLSTFYADPVLFMAVPLSIESITAFMPKTFIKALYECVKTWGYDQPPKACTFLASHIHTDGADDGHWISTRLILEKYLKSEHELQIFLNTALIVTRNIRLAYDSFVDDIPNLAPHAHSIPVAPFSIPLTGGETQLSA